MSRSVAAPRAEANVAAPAVGMAAAVVVMVGTVLPLGGGWAVPVLALVVGSAIAAWRNRGAGHPLRPAGWGVARWSALALAVLSTSVLVAVAGGSVGGLLVAFPGAIWVLPGVLGGAWVLPRVRGRGAPIAWLGLLVVVGLSGVWGARYEAAGHQARGWAHTGPIHGIHPFQITAVRIDGYGPFDLPFNDYVEPEGERGYTPETYAEALERALHDIAEIHYADGPARAYRAYAEASVEAVVTPAVEETLGVSPGADEHPRVIVRSGTWGQHSRVEFVCPGRRDDPRGLQPDNIMNRMCPSKYASEGSAGLGVTGRWPGYVEFRGNERTGWSRSMAWTRSDDEQGRRVTARERRWTAWGLLALVVVLLARPRSRAGLQGAGQVAAVVAVAGLVFAIWIGTSQPSSALGSVAAFERGSPVATGSLLAWLPGIVVLAGPPDLRHRVASAASRWSAGFVAAGTLLAASSVAGLVWSRPEVIPGGVGDPEPLERWVLGAAEAIGPRMGLDILEIEHLVAAGLVAVLVGALASWMARAGEFVSQVAPGSGSTEGSSLVPRAMRGGLVIAAVGFAFIISRKTGGGATLLPGALGLTWVLHAGLARLRHATGVPPSGLAGTAWLLISITIACALVLTPLLAPPISPSGGSAHPFVLLCVCGGIAAALSGLLFLRPPRDPAA